MGSERGGESMSVWVQLVHVNGEIGDVDDELILGPYRENVQLTYSLLRATYEDETVAGLHGDEWYTRDGRGPFSDVTFSEDRPESVMPDEPHSPVVRGKHRMVPNRDEFASFRRRHYADPDWNGPDEIDHAFVAKVAKQDADDGIA